MKKFLAILIIAAVFFIAGVAVGKFVMPRKIYITVVDIKDLVEIIERYNEATHELEEIKEWNKNAIIEPIPEEEESKKNN